MDDLKTDTGMHRATIVESRQKLIDAGIIETKVKSFENNGKKSEIHVTWYRLL